MEEKTIFLERRLTDLLLAAAEYKGCRTGLAPETGRVRFSEVQLQTPRLGDQSAPKMLMETLFGGSKSPGRLPLSPSSHSPQRDPTIRKMSTLISQILLSRGAVAIPVEKLRRPCCSVCQLPSPTVKLNS